MAYDYRPKPHGWLDDTLELARKVEVAGRVIAIDIQPQMLDRLERRAKTAGLQERIETRLAKSDPMAMTDLAQTVDFVFAYAVVHELPDDRAFFQEAFVVLKPGASLFIAEPGHHVSAGIGHKALLRKPPAREYGHNRLEINKNNS